MNIASIIDGHPASAAALIAPDDTVITYGELRERGESLRGGLSSIGVEPGDRVAIVLGNTPSFVTSYLALLGLGAVAVLCNPGSPEAELDRELRSVMTTFAIVGPTAAAAVSRIGLGTVIAADGAQV